MRDGDIAKLVSQRIRSLRNARGFSAYRLAREAGLTTEMVTRAEEEERMPTVQTLSRLCDALGISLAEFFSWEAPPLRADDGGLARVSAALRHLSSEGRAKTLRAFVSLARSLASSASDPARKRARVRK